MNLLGKLANFPKAEIVLLSAECISGRRSHFNVLSSLHSFSSKKLQQNGEEGQWRGFFPLIFLIQILAGAAKSCFMLDYLGNFFFFCFLKIHLGTEYLMIHNKYVHAVYIMA